MLSYNALNFPINPNVTTGKISQHCLRANTPLRRRYTTEANDRCLTRTCVLLLNLVHFLFHFLSFSDVSITRRICLPLMEIHHRSILECLFHCFLVFYHFFLSTPYPLSSRHASIKPTTTKTKRNKYEHSNLQGIASRRDEYYVQFFTQTFQHGTIINLNVKHHSSLARCEESNVDNHYQSSILYQPHHNGAKSKRSILFFFLSNFISPNRTILYEPLQIKSFILGITLIDRINQPNIIIQFRFFFPSCFTL